FKLRGENQLICIAVDVERLDTEAVAAKHEPSLLAVPEREGKHTPELVDQPLSFLLIKVDQNLGITLRSENVPLSAKPGPQIFEVVDFAVEDDPDRAIFIRQRLIASGQIDDG